jgi:type II secretory pathway predicted ATPase ExeA
MSKQLQTSTLDSLPAEAFGKAVGPDSVFMYAQLQELHERLKRAVAERTLAVVTGKSGLGKTTAVRAYTDSLPSNQYRVLYFGQDQDGAGLLQRFAQALGLRPRHFRNQLPMQISQALTDNMQEGGKKVVAIFDEAHLLDVRTLEDLRLLTNNEFDTSSPLTIILLGQQALRILLKDPALEALDQRLRYRFALEGLSLQETENYIRHRLTAFGASAEVFTDEALQKIFDASEGVPREINNLCALTLMKAQFVGANQVDGKLVKQVVSQRELS